MNRPCRSRSPPNLGEVHVIQLTSALPPAAHSINIDATMQSGASCTPIPNLRVQIANPSAVAVDGLTLDVGADFSSVSGLADSGFSAYARAGIYVRRQRCRQSAARFRGTNASGTTAQPNCVMESTSVARAQRSGSPATPGGCRI